MLILGFICDPLLSLSAEISGGVMGLRCLTFRTQYRNQKKLLAPPTVASWMFYVLQTGPVQRL